MTDGKDPHLLAHEALCAERYKNIEDKLDSIFTYQEKNHTEIQHLKEVVAMGNGVVKVLMVIGGVIAFGWSIFKGIFEFIKQGGGH